MISNLEEIDLDKIWEFESRVFGFLRRKVELPVEELAKVLYGVGMVESWSKAKELVPYLNGQVFLYNVLLGQKGINFEKIITHDGKEAFRIRRQVREPINPHY